MYVIGLENLIKHLVIARQKIYISFEEYGNNTFKKAGLGEIVEKCTRNINILSES